MNVVHSSSKWRHAPISPFSITEPWSLRSRTPSLFVSLGVKLEEQESTFRFFSICLILYMEIYKQCGMMFFNPFKKKKKNPCLFCAENHPQSCSGIRFCVVVIWIFFFSLHVFFASVFRTKSTVPTIRSLFPASVTLKPSLNPTNGAISEVGWFISSSPFENLLDQLILFDGCWSGYILSWRN